MENSTQQPQQELPEVKPVAINPVIRIHEIKSMPGKRPGREMSCVSCEEACWQTNERQELICYCLALRQITFNKTGGAVGQYCSLNPAALEMLPEQFRTNTLEARKSPERANAQEPMRQAAPRQSSI